MSEGVSFYRANEMDIVHELGEETEDFIVLHLNPALFEPKEGGVNHLVLSSRGYCAFRSQKTLRSRSS